MNGMILTGIGFACTVGGFVIDELQKKKDRDEFEQWIDDKIDSRFNEMNGGSDET